MASAPQKEQHPVETVMVVDDEPASLDLLETSLSHAGYRVRLFSGGKLAIASAREEPPDILLLDIRMPAQDGFEVCRLFKEQETLRDIPVLFLSAHSSTAEITRGFDCGAVDYITKPFREAEVLARLRTHLALRQAYARLDEQHRHLKALEQQRDTYVHMLVHDMRTPLLAMRGHLQQLNSSFARNLDGESLASLHATIHCTRLLSRMVSTVVDISRMEQAKFTPKQRAVTVNELFFAAREQVLDPLTPHPVSEHIAAGCPPVLCDNELTARILANLLANAVKYAPGKSAIIMGGERHYGSHVRLWVKDQGPGIPRTDQERIFEKFAVSQSEPCTRSPSTGIGLAFCKLAAEAQGGRVGLVTHPGCGSTFWVVLPAAPEPAQT